MLKDHTKTILVVASVILIALGLKHALFFRGGSRLESAEQQDLTRYMDTDSIDSSSINSAGLEYNNSADIMKLKFTNFVDPEQLEIKGNVGSDRLFKVTEPTSMLFLGTMLLLFGKLGRKKKKS